MRQLKRMILAMLCTWGLISQIACIEQAKEDPRKKAIASRSTGDTSANTGGEAPASGDVNEFINTASHNPAPCATCHNDERPASPHNQNDDCVGCHSYAGGWIAPATSFDHGTDPAACATCHEDDRPTDPSHPASGECKTCHWFPDWIELK